MILKNVVKGFWGKEITPTIGRILFKSFSIYVRIFLISAIPKHCEKIFIKKPLERHCNENERE